MISTVEWFSRQENNQWPGSPKGRALSIEDKMVAGGFMSATTLWMRRTPYQMGGVV